MTVSARASFDVSQHITKPELPDPAKQLVYFTPSRHRSAAEGEPISGLPAYDSSPNCFPVYVGANIFARLPRGIAYTEFPINADPYYLEKDPEFGNHPVSGTVSFSWALAVQSLSIANSDAQNVVSLFR